jgi:hypothetical protein
MKLIFRRKLVQRSKFRKLPFGALHNLSGHTGNPAYKVGRRYALNFFSDTTFILSTLSDTSVNVVRLQPPYLELLPSAP